MHKFVNVAYRCPKIMAANDDKGLEFTFFCTSESDAARPKFAFFSPVF